MDTIIFDVDDTLYDQTIPFKKAFRGKFQEAFTEKWTDVMSCHTFWK